MLEQYDDLLTLDELCEVLQIGRNTAYQILNSGFMSAFRIGRRWKIPKTSIEEVLKTKRRS